MNQYDTYSVRVRKLTSFWKSGVGGALIMVGFIAAFYLVREHWPHFGSTWPYLLLLVCPLMHLLMPRIGSHIQPGSNVIDIKPANRD